MTGEKKEPEDDRRKKSTVIPRLDRGICKGDVRDKSEHDNYLLVIAGLDPAIQRSPERATLVRG